MSAWRLRARRAGTSRRPCQPRRQPGRHGEGTNHAPAVPVSRRATSNAPHGSDARSIMRLPQQQLPNEPPDRGSCRRYHIATTPPFRRAPPAAHACGTARSGRTQPSVPACVWSRWRRSSYAATSGSMGAVNSCGRGLVFGTATFTYQAVLFQRRQHHAKFARGKRGHRRVRISSTVIALAADAERRPSISAMKSSCVGYRPAMKNRCRPRSRR